MQFIDKKVERRKQKNMTVELTQEEVDYIDKKLCMSRFTIADYYIVERILQKLGKLHVVKLKRREIIDKKIQK